MKVALHQLVQTASRLNCSSTHMVVLGGLEEDPEQPVGPRAGAGRQHGLIQVVLGLQGQHLLQNDSSI